MSEIEPSEEIEPTLSFASTNDLYNLRLKQELLTCLKFLIKILSPDDIPMVSQDFSLHSPMVFLQNCFNLSENIKKLVKQGHGKKHFALTLPQLSLSSDLDVSVISHCSGKDVLALLLRCDSSGVYLSPKESRNLFSLIVGSARDTALQEIHLTCRNLHEKTCKKRKKIRKLAKVLPSSKEKLKKLQEKNDSSRQKISELKTHISSFEIQLESQKLIYSSKINENHLLLNTLLRLRTSIKSSLSMKNNQVNLQLIPSLLPEDRVIL